MVFLVDIELILFIVDYVCCYGRLLFSILTGIVGNFWNSYQQQYCMEWQTREREWLQLKGWLLSSCSLMLKFCRLLLLNVGCTRSYAFIVSTPQRDELQNQEWFFAHVYRIQGSPMRFEILTAKIPQIMRVPEMADSIYM